MATMRKVLETISYLENQLARQHAIKRELEAKTKLVCRDNCFGKGCGKVTEIRKLVYLDMQYYPQDCDYLCSGEPHYICTKCGHQNRTFDLPNKNLIRCSSDLFMEKHKMQLGNGTWQRVRDDLEPILQRLKLVSKDTRFE